MAILKCFDFGRKAGVDFRTIKIAALVPDICGSSLTQDAGLGRRKMDMNEVKESGLPATPIRRRYVN